MNCTLLLLSEKIPLSRILMFVSWDTIKYNFIRPNPIKSSNVVFEGFPRKRRQRGGTQPDSVPIIDIFKTVFIFGAYKVMSI